MKSINTFIDEKLKLNKDTENEEFVMPKEGDALLCIKFNVKENLTLEISLVHSVYEFISFNIDKHELIYKCRTPYYKEAVTINSNNYMEEYNASSKGTFLMLTTKDALDFLHMIQLESFDKEDLYKYCDKNDKCIKDHEIYINISKWEFVDIIYKLKNFKKSKKI